MDAARLGIEGDEVGEGATDIDGDENHDCEAPLCAADYGDLAPPRNDFMG